MLFTQKRGGQKEPCGERRMNEREQFKQPGLKKLIKKTRGDQPKTSDQQKKKTAVVKKRKKGTEPAVEEGGNKEMQPEKRSDRTIKWTTVQRGRCSQHTPHKTTHQNKTNPKQKKQQQNQTPTPKKKKTKKKKKKNKNHPNTKTPPLPQSYATQKGN